jgi:hypothetical protein
MIYELRPLDRKDAPSAETPAQPMPLTRVATLPGAERRILRKRLERPGKTDRKHRSAARRAAR